MVMVLPSIFHLNLSIQRSFTGRQDNVVGYHDAWRLIEDYPRATFAVLDMAGHNLQIEQPDVFNSLVDNWLNRLESENV